MPLYSQREVPKFEEDSKIFGYGVKNPANQNKFAPLKAQKRFSAAFVLYFWSWNLRGLCALCGKN
jgi:hypothetical protein